MKRVTVLSILLIMMSVFSNAQALKYRCYKDRRIEDGKESAWQEVDILIVVIAHEHLERIRVFAKQELDIDVINYEVVKTTNGDKEVNFIGVDDDGMKCTGSFTVYKDQSPPHIATLIINYSNLNCIYRLKEN